MRIIYINFYGHLEENEIFEECLKREILEETGIEIEKLTKKKKETTELFSLDDIDSDTFEQIKETIDNLNKELSNIKKKRLNLM